VVSVNVGLPRKVLWNGKEITTGIFKKPVLGQVKVRKLGFDGDRQADPTVHGGPKKAIYAYPSEHYRYWRTVLARQDLSWGMFGENLTTEGLLEDAVHIGDEFQIGTAEVAVTQPRFPCFKLGIKFGTMEMVERFQTSGRSGFYLAVLKEGEIAAEDPIQLVNQSPTSPTVADTFMSSD
jgi:MOSC domain-containing protein YiiM